MSINLNHTGNGNITLKSPNSGAPVLTLPAADGTPGQVLTTDGSGNLSFTTPSGGGGTSTVGFEQTFLLMGA